MKDNKEKWFNLKFTYDGSIESDLEIKYTEIIDNVTFLVTQTIDKHKKLQKVVKIRAENLEQ